jgi:hypothetical protein
MLQATRPHGLKQHPSIQFHFVFFERMVYGKFTFGYLKAQGTL